MSACQVFTLHWQLLLLFWICDPSLFHIFIAVVLWHKYDKIWCDANKRSAVYVPQPHTQFTFFSYLFIFLSFKKTCFTFEMKIRLFFFFLVFLPFEFFSDLKHQARGVKDESCFSMASHTWLTLRLLRQVLTWSRRPSTPWWRETVTRWETHRAAGGNYQCAVMRLPSFYYNY